MLRSDRPARARLAKWLLAASLALATPANATSLSFNGSTDYARVTQSVLTGAPLTMCGWVNATSLAANGVVFGVYAVANTTTNFIQVAILTSGAIRVTTTDATSANADGTATLTTGTWHHVCGLFASASSRKQYLDGVNNTSDSSTHTPTGLDTFGIGARANGTPATFCNCLIAQVAYWKVALTLSDIQALATGVSPTDVKPESLVFFAPYLGVGSVVTDWKGNNMTITGAVTNAGTPAGVQHP